ncbi:MAG: hypothetical protein WEF51_04850, partial [Chloroflexota bacterium]
MRRTGPILIVVIGVLALLVDFFPGLRLPTLGGDGTRTVETKLGLDLEGGLRVEYQALPAGGTSPDLAALGVIRDIVERRVNGIGVSEPVVTTQGSDRIVVEMPGETDREAIERLVGQTGRLDFVPIPPGEQPPTEGQTLDPATHPALFSGDEVTSATIGTDPTTGGRTVNFVLKEVGTAKFAAHTAANVNEFFAITLDGKVISAPQIRSAIPNGQVVIEAGGAGGFSLAEATDLVTVLRFGSLPFPITQVSAEQISATLGTEFLDRSLLAGAIGILLVLLFMIVHYRLPGVIAGFALIYYTL